MKNCYSKYRLFLAAVLTLVMCAALCSCNNAPASQSSSSDENDAGDISYESSDYIKTLLVNNYASDNGSGRHYDYVQIATVTDDEDNEYYVFSQRLSSEEDDEITTEHIAYIFVCAAEEKAYVGSFNEESLQYKFQKEIYIFQ